MKPILGIDVAKTKLDCALRLPDGKFRSKVVDNTPHGFEIVSAWLAKHNLVDLHVCMEATGTYWEAMAEFLADAGYAVSVVNPAQIKAFGTASRVRTRPTRSTRGSSPSFAFPSALSPGRHPPRRSGNCGPWWPDARPWTPRAPRREPAPRGPGKRAHRHRGSSGLPREGHRRG